jgi:hypothetical protein
MSVNPVQSWITPETSLFGLGNAGNINCAFLTATTGIASGADVTAQTTLAGSNVLASTINAGLSITAGTTLAGSNLSVSTITSLGDITTQGGLIWSIYNSGATSCKLTGLIDNKAVRQASIIDAGSTNPTLLQASEFRAIGTGGSGIASFGASATGEPLIYSSYSTSNATILTTASNAVQMNYISSIGDTAGSNINMTALISTLASVYPGVVS